MMTAKKKGCKIHHECYECLFTAILGQEFEENEMNDNYQASKVLKRILRFRMWRQKSFDFGPFEAKQIIPTE